MLLAMHNLHSPASDRNEGIDNSGTDHLATTVDLGNKGAKIGGICICGPQVYVMKLHNIFRISFLVQDSTLTLASLSYTQPCASQLNLKRMHIQRPSEVRVAST